VSRAGFILPLAEASAVLISAVAFVAFAVASGVL
jgi:hypothetical protein